MHIEIDKSTTSSYYFPAKTFFRREEAKIFLGNDNQEASLAHELGHHFVFKAIPTLLVQQTCSDILYSEYLAWEWAAQHAIFSKNAKAFAGRCLKSYIDAACDSCVKLFVQWLQARENL